MCHRVQATRLSVRCPVGLKAIRVPVRGARCTHLQCFDLTTFLEMNQHYSSGRWRCPVCSTVTLPGALRVDRYFTQVIARAATDFGDRPEDVEVRGRR